LREPPSNIGALRRDTPGVELLLGVEDGQSVNALTLDVEVKQPVTYGARHAVPFGQSQQLEHGRFVARSEARVERHGRDRLVGSPNPESGAEITKQMICRYLDVVDEHFTDRGTPAEILYRDNRQPWRIHGKDEVGDAVGIAGRAGGPAQQGAEVGSSGLERP